MLQKGSENAIFDIRDIRGGFDTGQLFANNKNNLEHKRSDHIWTLSTVRTFLFGIIKSSTDPQLRQSDWLMEYRSSRRAVYFILQLHYKKPITHILPPTSLA